jgi:BNR repeat-containing family member
MKATLILVLSAFWMNASLAQVKVLEVVDVDSVTSDFPVNFSFLQQGDWQFIGYFNKDRYLTVASRQVFEKQWAYKILPTKVGWDSHNAITMAIDRDNCLHISGNMHNDTLLYFKTEKPFQIASFQRILPQVSIQDELSCTYPNFVKDANGRVIYSYRIGSSGKGNTITNVYDEATKTFKRLTDKPLFDGMDEMSAYSGGAKLEKDGFFHLTWVWRDTPDCETNHDLSYAKSKDFIHWETMTGEKVELPITPLKKQFTVDAIPAKGGIINGGWVLFFGDNKNPCFAFHKYDAAGISQVFIAKSNGKDWQIKQVSNWNFRWAFSGQGSIESDIKINSAELKADNTLKITYWHIKKGYGEISVDNKTGALIEDKTVEIPTNIYPIDLLQPNSGIEGMSVKWQNGKGNAKEFYALRWETLGKRRFYKKREKAVPPTIMKLYKIVKQP